LRRLHPSPRRRRHASVDERSREAMLAYGMSAQDVEEVAGMVVIMQRPSPGPMVSAPPLPRMPSEHRAATHAMARETETSSPREHVSRKETGAPPTTPAAAASTATQD
jgi:hypothetical protein